MQRDSVTAWSDAGGEAEWVETAEEKKRRGGLSTGRRTEADWLSAVRVTLLLAEWGYS